MRPAQRVKVLQHIRGKKWRAEWIEPNPGLVEYVESQNLVVRWKDRKAFLLDEEHDRKLRADNESHGYEEDSPLANLGGHLKAGHRWTGQTRPKAETLRSEWL